MNTTTFTPETWHIVYALGGILLGIMARHWGLIGGPAAAPVAVPVTPSASPPAASPAGPATSLPLSNDIAARINDHIEAHRQKALDQVVTGILGLPKTGP